jgi:hypothetical protein
MSRNGIPQLRDGESSEYFGKRLAQEAKKALAAWNSGRGHKFKEWDEEATRKENVQLDQEVHDEPPEESESDDGDDNPHNSLADYVAGKTQATEQKMIDWIDGVGPRPDVVPTPKGDGDPIGFEEEQIIRKHLGKNAEWFITYYREHFLIGPRDGAATDVERQKFLGLSRKLWIALKSPRVNKMITEQLKRSSAWKPTDGEAAPENRVIP